MADLIRDKVNAIDLTQQKRRLRKDKGLLWCVRHNLNDLERQYKAFLYKIATNPGVIFRPPTDAMDQLWHAHVLYTQKYASDCNAICGKFIHHHPDEIGGCIAR